MLLLFLLTILGALSPLLTFAWLWQLKEWRSDRLLEHLRREGWVGQLWGKLRPLLVALYVCAVLVPGVWMTFFVVLVVTGTQMILATLTVAQFVMGRQRRPVMTRKAMTVTGTALLMTAGMAAASWAYFPLALPVIVLLQPLSVTLAWLVWKPIDGLLKRKIIARARTTREAHPDSVVIGVTGSVGKTTTKELLACVLKDLQPLVTPAHVNSEIGVAQWLTDRLRVSGSETRDGHSQPVTRDSKLLIVEMGAYKKGEIALMASYAKPTMGVVTHVGTQHIALFGSQEALFAAKSELVQSLPADGRAFLNGDNGLARRMVERSPCPVTIVGTGGRCDLEAFDIEETSTGIRFRAGDTVFDLPLHGTHNVTNALLAIAVGESLGVTLPRMRELLRTFVPLSGTFSVREEAGVQILDDTHNSSVASLKAAIAWARTRPEERKVLLATGLIEMGEMQAPAERELGALAAAVFERTVVIDPQSARNFAAGGRNVETLSGTTARAAPGSLLVCAGRMSAGTVRRLLPVNHS